MEEHRRTPEGRVRTAKDLVAHFFPHDENAPNDRCFHFIPKDVRGPILSGWGIRGVKSASRDDDARVRSVVYDALVAGDIDEDLFEFGVAAQILVDWVPLTDWWTFWRKGKLTGVAIQKALATARELGLIDDKWFFENLQGRGGKLKGTDVVCDTLPKDQIMTWLRNVHASGDGSPAGLVAAIGWDTILQKTAEEALLFALDAFAKKAGLVAEEAPASVKEEPAAAEPPPSEPAVEPTTVEVKAVEPKAAEPKAAEPKSVEASGAPIEESPKLAEARAAMMKMLNQPGSVKTAEESEVPGRPSSLEWPEPPPIEVPVVIEEPPPVAKPPPSKAKPAPTPQALQAVIAAAKKSPAAKSR